MNYYEELGIRSDADEEEIRKAHRRLVKLMHPDQHRDAGLKALAETQMRRLNSIVATLLDPEERSEYDEELRGGIADAAKQGTPQSSWRAVPWWIGSILAAIVLTVGTLWFFADRMGPRGNRAPVDITGETSPTPPSPVQKPVEKPPVQQPSVTEVTVPTSPPVVKEQPKEPEPLPVPVPTPAPIPVQKQEPVKLPTPPPTVLAKKEPPKPVITLPKQIPVPAPQQVKTAVASVPKNVTPTPVAPPIAPPKKVFPGAPVVTASVQPKQTILEASAPAPGANLVPAGMDIPRRDYSVPGPPTTPKTGVRMQKDPLEGEWVFAPTEPQERIKGLYPPEFINLRLKRESSGMRGEYSARYDVDGSKSVLPDVSFVLVATDPSALRYQWTARDGSRGTLDIKDLQSDSLRLEWKETVKRGGQTFTRGVATLVRKN